jgi:hypothetical protein
VHADLPDLLTMLADELATEHVKVQREQAAWSSTVQQLEQNVQVGPTLATTAVHAKFQAHNLSQQ